MMTSEEQMASAGLIDARENWPIVNWLQKMHPPLAQLDT